MLKLKNKLNNIKFYSLNAIGFIHIIHDLRIVTLNITLLRIDRCLKKYVLAYKRNIT